jgi:hypothetical protein
MGWTDGIEGAFIKREKLIFGFVTPAFYLKTINIKTVLTARIERTLIKE